MTVEMGVNYEVVIPNEYYVIIIKFIQNMRYVFEENWRVGIGGIDSNGSYCFVSNMYIEG